MTSDPLERLVISYIHGQFVIINEKSNVADAVKTMNKKNAETIIVTNYFDVGELDIIDSISLVFATITGGGFVPVSTFIIVDNIEQLIILMSGMILSALPYAFHYGLFSRDQGTTAYIANISIFCFYDYVYCIICNLCSTYKGSHLPNNKINVNDTKRGSIPTHRTSILSTMSNNKIMRDIILVIILFPAVSLGTAIAISYFNGSDLSDTFFESVSAVTNTGLTSGITSIDLDIYSKIILSVNMIIA